jgi:hypothetical protein
MPALFYLEETMKGSEIVEWIQKNKAEDINFYVNFSFNENGAFVSDIKNINYETDDGNVFICIGSVDEYIKNESNRLAFPCIP